MELIMILNVLLFLLYLYQNIFERNVILHFYLSYQFSFMFLSNLFIIVSVNYYCYYYYCYYYFHCFDFEYFGY